MATKALGDAEERPVAPPGAKEGIGRSTLIPTLTFGLVLGALQVALALSFAALIFGGSLSAHVGSGAGLALVSATVILFVVALGSSLAGSVASVQAAPRPSSRSSPPRSPPAYRPRAIKRS
jgi:hypothetical protein